MSDLPHDALDYQAVVAEYFLGLRGSGLMLSPLDQDAVADWERRGVPVAVVCRGLRRGVEELAGRRAGAPRSIRALRLAVEDEWRAYRQDRVGDAPPPPAGEQGHAQARLDAARDLVAAAGARARAEHQGGYRAAWRVLSAADARAGSPLERVEAALAAADGAVLAAWLAVLPAPERRALGARVRLLAGARGPGASPRAHRETLRSHLFDLAREAGLTCLRGSV
jgi:hypothetical protein